MWGVEWNISSSFRIGFQQGGLREGRVDRVHIVNWSSWLIQHWNFVIFQGWLSVICVCYTIPIMAVVRTLLVWSVQWCYNKNWAIASEITSCWKFVYCTKCYHQKSYDAQLLDGGRGPDVDSRVMYEIQLQKRECSGPKSLDVRPSFDQRKTF